MDPELAITIRVPDEATEVLVRLPVTEGVTVDFRGVGSVWTPSDFFPNSIDRKVQ